MQCVKLTVSILSNFAGFDINVNQIPLTHSNEVKLLDGMVLITQGQIWELRFRNFEPLSVCLLVGITDC